MVTAAGNFTRVLNGSKKFALCAAVEPLKKERTFNTEKSHLLRVIVCDDNDFAVGETSPRKSLLNRL